MDGHRVLHGGEPPSRPGLGATPLVASLLSGLIASLCCGGELVFAALGLGAAFGALQTWRYIPWALALGAASIVGINYWYYRRLAARAALGPGAVGGTLRRPMLVSGLLGLLMMAASVTALEWLNHAVVHAARFMAHPDYARALIPGVPDGHLRSVVLTFLGLPVLAALPLPRAGRAEVRSGPSNVVSQDLCDCGHRGRA